jgi:hypothetical protein
VSRAVRESLAVIALVLLSSITGRSDEPADDLNAKVIAFAKSKVGEQVGTGDCTDLLVEAFKEAGARPCIKADDGVYLWGQPVKSYKEAKPGDVVQFEKVVFKGTRRSVDEDGHPSLSYHKDTFPHHSAVVLSVSAKNKTLTLLHQNVADEEGKLDRTVREQTLRMTELQKGGALTIFRPTRP